MGVSGAISVDPETNHRRAVAAARSAADALSVLGVAVLVTGSLARGRFGPHSDIDFLVTSCPRDRKYAIEGIIEDRLDGFRFDVVYLDEIPAWKVPRFTNGAVDARDLR
jgi:predicted nucleotidyltransferase